MATEIEPTHSKNLPIRRRILDYLFLVLISSAIVALDQWTKALVRSYIPLGGDWLPAWLDWLAPYARLRHWHNSGAAFGLFQDGNLVFTILAILVSLGIIYYFPRAQRHEGWLRLALAMQLAGAVGNLIDRLQFGRVTDFISVGNFAVFNVADSSITVGTAIMLIGALWAERQAKRQTVEKESERTD